MRRVDDAQLPGASRRAALRFALGKPGSLRRWLVSTVAALLAAALFYVMTDNVLAIFFVALVAFGAFFWRSHLIGDEDELKAEFPAKVVEAFRNPAPVEPNDGPSAPPDWITTQLEHFADVPPPPIAEQGDETVE